MRGGSAARFPREVRAVKFRVVKGDIADQSADALVNAAGTSLVMGSGVAGALRRKGGEELNREAVSKGPIGLGEVAVTGAYRLDARYVIHAAAMPHYGDGRATAQSIRDATRNSLRAADDLGCESIVIPALGCGVAGFPLREGLEIIMRAILDYEPRSLKDCRVILYDEREYQEALSVAEALS